MILVPKIPSQDLPDPFSEHFVKPPAALIAVSVFAPPKFASQRSGAFRMDGGILFVEDHIPQKLQEPSACAEMSLRLGQLGICVVPTAAGKAKHLLVVVPGARQNPVATHHKVRPDSPGKIIHVVRVRELKCQFPLLLGLSGQSLLERSSTFGLNIDEHIFIQERFQL